jgi:hypothetical protein
MSEVWGRRKRRSRKMIERSGVPTSSEPLKSQGQQNKEEEGRCTFLRLLETGSDNEERAKISALVGKARLGGTRLYRANSPPFGRSSYEVEEVIFVS